MQSGDALRGIVHRSTMVVGLSISSINGFWGTTYKWEPCLQEDGQGGGGGDAQQGRSERGNAGVGLQRGGHRDQGRKDKDGRPLLPVRTATNQVMLGWPRQALLAALRQVDKQPFGASTSCLGKNAIFLVESQ
jgi:hypothetical protein